MRKAINFDLDTKKYELITNKKSPTAYGEIKKFMKKYNFIHRQGSGYVSRESIHTNKVIAIIQNMSFQLYWLRFVVKEIDMTNIGKTYSLKVPVNKAPLSKEINN